VIAQPILDGYEKDRQDLTTHLPPELQFEHKVHITLMRAMSAMARMDLKSPTCDVSVLRSLISIFDASLLSLASPAPSDIGEYLPLVCIPVAKQPRRIPTQLCAYPCHGVPLLRTSFSPRPRGSSSHVLTLPFPYATSYCPGTKSGFGLSFLHRQDHDTHGFYNSKARAQ
jgi:hypothetical protein